MTATQEGAEEMLRDLEMLRGKYEMIGSYPDLVAQAQMWDGKTEVDPVGLYLERVQEEREQARAEGELDADAYLAEQARKAAAAAVPTLSFSMGNETYTTRVLSKAYGTDSNGNKLRADTFVTTPMGNVDWYRFPQDEKTQKLLAKHGVKNLPIRLRVGKQNNREHKGYGFIHMLSHFDEYVKVGETPLLHLFNTLSNLVKIRGGSGGRYQFKGEYERGRDSLLIAQLMEEDGYYSIVSSYPTQMNRTPRRGELVIGRVLFQFPSNSKKAQIPVSKSQEKAVTTSVSTSDQASQEKIAQAAQQVNIYDLQIRNANGEVIFQQGVEPKVTFSLTPEMESIKADAVAAGTFMKAPNGKDTNLTERQWLQVRTAAFKRWFGDWEKVARFRAVRDAIMNMPVVAMLTGQEFQSDGVKLTDKVPAYWDGKYQGSVESPDLGRVVLDKEGVQSSIGHGAGRLKAAAFYAVPDVIQKGRVFDRRKDWKGRGYDTAVIAAPVSIGEKEYICEVVVEQRSNRQGFYVHEVEIKEKLGNVFKTATKGSTRQASRSILALRDAEVNTIWKNCSKVVDENWEPLVVTHATNSEPFTVFKRGERAGLSGKGISQNRGTFDGCNPDITFSVVGEHAANWDEIKHLAFKGRDDGKQRVELDASGMIMMDSKLLRLRTAWIWIAC